MAAQGLAFDFEKYSYRIDEALHALNGMLAHETYEPLIDRRLIAAGGHSFGGYTTLALAGAIEGRKDDRVKAVLMLSPGLFMFDKDDFARVAVPTMYMLGEQEQDQPRQGGTKLDLGHRAFALMAPPRYFLLIAGAEHSSFADPMRRRLGGRRSGAEESQRRALIQRYSIAFLERHVLKGEAAESVLARRDPALLEYERVLD
jgi:predicted dienelactone hydrolase